MADLKSAYCCHVDSLGSECVSTPLWSIRPESTPASEAGLAACNEHVGALCSELERNTVYPLWWDYGVEPAETVGASGGAS